MKHLLLLLTSCLLFPASGFPQVTLQPWVQVFGTMNGQELGKNVTGITPSANFPYRAAVSKNGSTSVYQLNPPTDTSAQIVFPGENLLTGDLNGDGYTDVVVTRTVNFVDTVIVYWGIQGGIDTANGLRIPGEAQSDRFQAAIIADVNNDGFKDLVIKADEYGPAQGKVYFHFGPLISAVPNAVVVGDSTLSRLGLAVAVGDLNDDSSNDLIIRGAYNAGPTGEWYDYVNIYWGVGLDTLDLDLDVQLRGYRLTSAGLACFDANGDSIDDLLWTNRDTLDWVYVHYGGAAFDTLPSLRLRDPQFALYGNAIANAGDMNGDGYYDVVVGAYASITSGFVFVYGGGPTIDQYFDAAVGMSSDSYFGWSISSIGDVSSDGLSDIIVGAPNYEFGSDKGYWGIFLGNSSIGVSDVNNTQFLEGAT